MCFGNDDVVVGQVAGNVTDSLTRRLHELDQCEAEEATHKTEAHRALCAAELLMKTRLRINWVWSGKRGKRGFPGVFRDICAERDDGLDRKRLPFRRWQASYGRFFSGKLVSS